MRNVCVERPTRSRVALAPSARAKVMSWHIGWRRWDARRGSTMPRKHEQHWRTASPDCVQLWSPWRKRARCNLDWACRSVPTGLAPVERGFLHKSVAYSIGRPHRACPGGTGACAATFGERRSPLVQKPSLHRGKPGGGREGEARRFLCTSPCSTGASPVGTTDERLTFLVQKPTLYRGEPGGGPCAIWVRPLRPFVQRMWRAADLLQVDGKLANRPHESLTRRRNLRALDSRDDSGRHLQSGNIPDESLLRIAQDVDDFRTQCPRFIGCPQLLKIRQQHRLRLGPAAQHQMDPCPGFAVLGRRHLQHLPQPLQARQVRAESLARPANLRQVCLVDSLPVRLQLEVFRQTLVEPDRYVLEDAVQ